MRLIAVCVFLFASIAQAGIVARVLEAKGNAFEFNNQGKSKKLMFGSKIQDMSDIMVDDSSYLSVLDEQGNVYHLAGGTYAKFYNKMLEIKNGSVWLLSKGSTPALINTVNSIVSANSGQMIVSVDNSDLKTQTLVLTGEAKLASSVEPELSIRIPAGHFSFIDNAYEGGLPRAPTRVGLRSYQTMKMVFSGIKSLEKNNFDKTFMGDVAPSRGIASVKPTAKKGKVIFFKSGESSRVPASVEPSAMDYYKSVTSKVKKKAYPKLGSAQVNLHGFDFKNKNAEPIVEQVRVPASVKEEKKVEKKAEKKSEAVQVNPIKTKIIIKPITEEEVKKKAARVPASVGGSDIISDINSAFEKSLSNKIESNKRHPDEVNQLIDELNSFKRDYSKNY